MTRASKLKVYRTAIGFHDAYVAAPSRKAALAAWGSDKDLFARGLAEVVIDIALAAEPLAQPGKVVKRLRGTVAEQIAALPPDAPGKRVDQAPPAPSRAKARPKPSRSALDAAEQAIVDTEAAQAAVMDDLATREAALTRERRTAEEKHAAEADQLGRALTDARQSYDTALAGWRG